MLQVHKYEAQIRAASSMCASMCACLGTPPRDATSTPKQQAENAGREAKREELRIEERRAWGAPAREEIFR
jgi:GTP cyclohydrolase III